jgi:tape measure domain-containing protein
MNVRELVTVLKFKTDSASLKSAENAVNRIKTIMQRTKPLNLKVNTGNAQKSVNALTSKLNQLQQNKRVRINVDTSQIDKATQSLNRLSQAQMRASQAHFKGKAQGLAQGKTQSKNTAQAGGMGIVGGLKGAFVALGGMAIVSEIKQTADAMMSLSSRIKLVTKDETERLRVERALYDMSNRNRASLEDVGDLYYKTALSAKQFGISQEDLLRMTDIVTKSLTIGGADTAQQKATILQLSQALGSGVLQGDELRSLRENAPKLMTQIAQYFGKTVAELKQMGAKGELTTDQLVKAILASGQTIDKEFGRITPTIGQAITVLGNKWSKFILDIQNNTGVFGQIAGLILKAVDLIGQGIDWAKEEFKTLEPDFQAFFGTLKELWTEMQPLLDNLGTIFKNWIIPALKTFLRVSIATFGMVADLLKPIVDFLNKIASLIATISEGLPGIIKGFDKLIAKAESGALEKYKQITAEYNQNNTVVVESRADAGRALREANSNGFLELTPDF